MDIIAPPFFENFLFVTMYAVFVPEKAYMRQKMLKPAVFCDKLHYGCYQDGRRLALFGGTVTLRLHRNPKGNLRKEG